VLEFQRTRLALFADPNVNTVPKPDCPSEADLRYLAAGLCSEPITQKLKAHAATCNHCGPLLQEYTEDFSDNFTPEEQAGLDQLNSASPEWQRQAARKMLQQAGVVSSAISNDAASAAYSDQYGSAPGSSAKLPANPVRRLLPWKWIVAPAAAAACAVIAFGVAGILYARRDTPKKAEGYLAQAFTQQRTMEARWPGAEWGRAQTTLGPSESVFSKPGPLIDAEKMIKDHRTASSDDSKWLRARAEVEILEGNPRYAIQLLNPAVQANPDSVPLMLDLALAYSQQFRNSGDHSDPQNAIHQLESVLKKEPENRTALFNLALAYADNEMWDEAVTTWDRYLHIETDPKWADEAREKRTKAQEKSDKAREKPHSTVQYPSYPSDLVNLFLALNDDEIAFRLEQYQEIALRNWLPKAVENPAGSEHQAVARLALVSEHHSADRWWRDFLKATSNHDASGVTALSAAFVDNIKGFYADAMDKSLRAARIFRQQQNLPGELRARLESVYAQRRLLNGKNCLARANPLRTQLALTSYTWLQSQLGMEIAVCLNYVDQLKESAIALSQSLSLAQKSNLPIAVLRNIGFAQSLDNQQGRYRSALDEGVKGLHNYWQGPPSTERIYQFYTGFSRSAQALGLWAAAEAFMRHAIDLLQAEEDDIQKGAAWLELSKILAAEKSDEAAEAAALKANQLFDGQRAEPTSRTYRLIGKIGLADLQLQHGKAEKALETLEPARELLSETDPYFVSLSYYRLFGNVNLALYRLDQDKSGNINFALDHLDQAASAYQQAILIAERALPGLKSNQSRLGWIAGSEDAYRGLVRVFIERHDPEDAWKLWEWYISRSYPEELITAAGGKSHAGAGWPELWTTISAISRSHNPATRAVYAVFDDGAEVWTVAENKLNAAWIPVTRAGLELMAQQFSQACARRDSPLAEVQKLGQDLFALLVQPVSKELPTRSLIRIELDRSLSGIPIEALRSPEGWYLGEKYPIVQSPGMLYERHLRQTVNLSSNARFLLADAAEGSFLPGHDLERSTIQKLFPKATILDPRADSAAIMTSLDDSVVFGFIGHGEQQGTGTGLRMNQHLLLKAEDFSPQSLRQLQLAVLAACSTGSSGNDGLLDNRNLVHAFLAGGVPSVVASRWNVDSEATAVLISNFYTSYAGRESAPDALFSARNQLLKTYSHPYYWAGFSVTGKVN
jgi:CHAT domain-containing protein